VIVEKLAKVIRYLLRKVRFIYNILLVFRQVGVFTGLSVIRFSYFNRMMLVYL